MPDPHSLPHLFALILAGGSGTRLWPLSRERSPKQLLELFGTESLISDTIRRTQRFASGGTHVLTSESLRNDLRVHLDRQFEGSAQETGNAYIGIRAEPAPRNTAFAIALAAAALVRSDPEAIIFALPSDHLIADDDEWATCVNRMYEVAQQDKIAICGLEPTRPETGFGYILPGEPLCLDDDRRSRQEALAEPKAGDGFHVFSVDRFVEKPSSVDATALIDKGALWNAGLFMMRACIVLDEFSRTGLVSETPDSSKNVLIRNAAETLAFRDNWTDDKARSIVRDVPSVPFDKAILEVSERVVVVRSSLTWSDVGTLTALDMLSLPDDQGNHFVGRTVDIGSHGSTVFSEDRLVATLGLQDIAVVDTADATLVASKDRLQDVRSIVDTLRTADAPEARIKRTVMRPWGSWTLLQEGPGFWVKRIEVEPGLRLSLQTHVSRSEHWVVVCGTALVTRNTEEFALTSGESAYLPAASLHRLTNVGSDVLVVIEVAIGDHLSEEDIIRIEDDWA